MKMLKTRANSTMGPFEISIKAPIFNHAQMDYSWIYATLIDETTALKLYSQITGYETWTIDVKNLPAWRGGSDMVRGRIEMVNAGILFGFS
ncbi:hypothetical protein AtNW77_Chr5g0086341 [Arabidopsis thaliana]